MGKWIGRNLAALLAFAVASFYFFGQRAIEVRNQFLHIAFLTPTLGYADLALVGFHPLFAYFIGIAPVIPYLYWLMLLRNRLGRDRSQPESEPSVPDARSNSGIPEIKHGNRRARSPWQFLKRNKLHSVVILLLVLGAFLQPDILQSLHENSNLIVKPASANFRIFGWKMAIEVFIDWGWFIMLAAFCTPVAPGFAYSKEQDQVLKLPGVQGTRLKPWIALTLFAAVISLLYYAAEFRGFFGATRAPEVCADATDISELKGRRIFLLGQNESLYAFLTSQPQDTRSIVFVKKDKIPVLVLGESVDVFEPLSGATPKSLSDVCKSPGSSTAPDGATKSAIKPRQNFNRPNQDQAASVSACDPATGIPRLPKLGVRSEKVICGGGIQRYRAV